MSNKIDIIARDKKRCQRLFFPIFRTALFYVHKMFIFRCRFNVFSTRLGSRLFLKSILFLDLLSCFCPNCFSFSISCYSQTLIKQKKHLNLFRCYQHIKMECSSSPTWLFFLGTLDGSFPWILFHLSRPFR
jgi:hypothetical protein